MAFESSEKNMIMKDEDLVTNSTKVSAGRLRERCVETDIRKAINVWRHELGNSVSAGMIGLYHHLLWH